MIKASPKSILKTKDVYKEKKSVTYVPEQLLPFFPIQTEGEGGVRVKNPPFLKGDQWGFALVAQASRLCFPLKKAPLTY